MVTPIHEIPGRFRFALPGLRGNPRAAAALRARIRAIEGVRSAQANPLTGSLIVRYDGAAQTRKSVFDGLGGFAPDPSAPAPAPAALSPAGTVANVLTKALMERIIERALRAAVAAVI